MAGEPSVISIFTNILRAIGQVALANLIDQEFADGKITIQEGVELGEAVTAALKPYLPGQAAELQLAHDVAAAVDAYLKAKAAATPAPKPATPPATGPGGPGGKVL